MTLLGERPWPRQYLGSSSEPPSKSPIPPPTLQAWCGNTIHWGTRCAPGSAAPPRVSVGFNFLRGNERLQSGAPSLSRADAHALGLSQRLAIIARSLLAYSPWYDLDDGTVPAEFFGLGA